MRRLLVPLILSLASCASAGGPAASRLAPIKVIPGYFGEARAPDGNTIVFEGRNGLVVVDTGRHLDHQEKILAYARERGKPIAALVNTHWHLDHSGGNAEIRAVHPDARLHTSNAVAGALRGFLARSLERARARLADPKVPEEQKAEVRLGVAAMEDRRNLLPDVPVTGPATLDAGGRRLELHLAGPAATAGTSGYTIRPPGPWSPATSWSFPRRSSTRAARKVGRPPWRRSPRCLSRPSFRAMAPR